MGFKGIRAVGQPKLLSNRAMAGPFCFEVSRREVRQRLALERSVHKVQSAEVGD